MAIPTDEASCVMWHEAYHATESNGVAVPGLIGVGGMPHGPEQTDSAAQPTVQLLGSGRRAYRFDDTDDWLAVGAALSSRPLTIVACFALKSTALGRRPLCNGPDGSNWLVGARSEVGGDYAFYNGAFIDSGVAADADVMRVHSVRQRASGTIADYRIDGAAVGTNSNTNVPGRIRIGGTSVWGGGETANCDLIGISAFSTDLSDAALAAQEAYWATGGAGTPTPAYNKLTQLVIESVGNGTPTLRNTQLAIESVNGANPLLRVSQLIIEVVVGLGPFSGQLRPRLRPEFGDARRIRDVNRGAGHRWIDNPGRRA